MRNQSSATSYDEQPYRGSQRARKDAPHDGTLRSEVKEDVATFVGQGEDIFARSEDAFVHEVLQRHHNSASTTLATTIPVGAAQASSCTAAVVSATGLTLAYPVLVWIRRV